MIAVKAQRWIRSTPAGAINPWARIPLGIMGLFMACVPVNDGRGHPSLLIITLEQAGGPDGLDASQPALAGFIRSGTLFPHVWHPSDSPLSAATSLFTGLHPRHTGVLSATDSLPENIPTLAERVYEQDVWTGAAVAQDLEFTSEGIERGFESFVRLPQEDSNQVAQAATAWLAERAKKDGGWMIWAHLGAQGEDKSSVDAALQSMISQARELDTLGRTMIIVMDVMPEQTSSLHQSWAAVSLPRSLEGTCPEDFAGADFCLLAVEHLAEAAWANEQRRPPGLDGVSPGLALFGLPARRGPLLLQQAHDKDSGAPLALFEGWQQSGGESPRASWSTASTPPKRVQAVLSEMLEGQ